MFRRAWSLRHREALREVNAGSLVPVEYCIGRPSEGGQGE